MGAGTPFRTPHISHRMHHFHDPSWCARINAHRSAGAEAAAARSLAPAVTACAATPEPTEPGEPARCETLPNGSPYRLREVPTTHACECCGTVMYDHHCKIVCPNCGYKRDCSDP